MAKVELLVHTYFGQPLKPGDIIEVDEKVAERWEKNGIARSVDNAPDDQKVSRGRKSKGGGEDDA